MADAAEAPPSKRQRLEAAFEAQGEVGRQKRRALCCSMCLGPFVEPVSVKPLGNTYCKGCITAWLSENRTDPLTGTRLTVREGNIAAVLVPNLAVQQIIDAQSVPCRYAARGCEACPALGDLEAHEANCPCKPSKCARCAFVGSRLEVAAHEQACPFVVLGPVLDAQDARIRGLEGEVRRLKEANEATQRLQVRLEALEAARPPVVSPARRRPRSGPGIVFNPPSEDDVREARALYIEGLRHKRCVTEWTGAIAPLRRCVELDPSHSRAWSELGYVLEEENDIPGAIEAVEECIRRGYPDDDPDNDGVQRLARLRARVLYDEGLRHKCANKWLEAIVALRRSVELDPNKSGAWFELGVAYYEQNGGESCEAQYEPYTRCIALDPKNAMAHNNLASVLMNVRKDYAGAERHYRKAIELNPKQTHACWNLSDLLEDERNDIRGAIEAIEEYIRRGNPGNDGHQRLRFLQRKLEASP